MSILANQYLVGEIEFFEDREEDPLILQPLADEVFKLYERLNRAVFKLSGERGFESEIPQSDPQTMSFQIAAAFNLDVAAKYELLKTRSTIERLYQLREILNESVSKLEDNAEINKIARTNGHSKKKLDI